MRLIHGDCIEAMAAMEPESVDAIVTDPPYGLEFMGKAWDTFKATGNFPGGGKPAPAGGAHARANGRERKGFDGWSPTPRYVAGHEAQMFHQQWAEAAYRVAKPSAYLLAFGGTRTVHRMTVALEDAGWIIRDMLVWGYACLSDDTEILTEEGWVRYNSPNVGQLAAAFDPDSGELRWQRIEAVHRYQHEGDMVEVGPSLVTDNHRVVIDEATGGVPCLPDMWHDVYSPVGVGQEGERVVLLPTMQRRRTATGLPLSDRDSSGLAGGVGTLALGEDDWTSQSGLEGRRYRVQEARELLWRAIRASSGVGVSDGEARWLRDGAPAEDGRDVRLPADQDGVREPRGPRPDQQRSGEPDPLAGQPDAQALRVGEVPGGDGEPDTLRDWWGKSNDELRRELNAEDAQLVEGYRGVVWCITVPTGAFLARRNGVVFVTGNSGFPKSKASLKPAWEPIVMARKPGPLRMLAIDECRIPAPDSEPLGGRDKWSRPLPGQGAAGRWPANVVLSDPIFDGGWEGVVGGGEVGPSYRPGDRALRNTHNAIYGQFPNREDGREQKGAGYGDSGTYSRFFLIPKADRSDREPVLGGLPLDEDKPLGALGNKFCTLCGESWVAADGWPRCGHGRENTGRRPALNPKPRANVHPTVKPTDLMRHLVRLVTPPGGTVLDPFGGSGTTALACEMEGFDWVLIEREEEYVRIAEARLNGTQRGLGLDVGAPVQQRKPSKTGWHDRPPTGPKGWSGGWSSDPDDGEGVA